jgi:hypothetical protein
MQAKMKGGKRVPRGQERKNIYGGFFDFTRARADAVDRFR